LIESLSRVKYLSWILDVAGDGPKFEELKEQVQKTGLSDRVIFHGFVDDTDKLLSRCSCFLFPSLSEGMGLSLMRAIQMGVPVIASDLPPVRELTDRSDSLVPPGNVEEWRIALEDFLRNGKVSEGFKKDRILSVSQMAERIEREVYLPLLKE
jgi:glycosyltransferase involved in cell wall biosynthesis